MGEMTDGGCADPGLGIKDVLLQRVGLVLDSAHAGLLFAAGRLQPPHTLRGRLERCALRCQTAARRCSLRRLCTNAVLSWHARFLEICQLHMPVPS